jgi:hypothetical protein
LLGIRDNEEFADDAEVFLEKLRKLYGKQFITNVLGNKT